MAPRRPGAANGAGRGGGKWWKEAAEAGPGGPRTGLAGPQGRRRTGDRPRDTWRSAICLAEPGGHVRCADFCPAAAGGVFLGLGGEETRDFREGIYI